MEVLVTERKNTTAREQKIKSVLFITTHTVGRRVKVISSGLVVCFLTVYQHKV